MVSHEPVVCCMILYLLNWYQSLKISSRMQSLEVPNDLGTLKCGIREEMCFNVTRQGARYITRGIVKLMYGYFGNIHTFGNPLVLWVSTSS
jgi:hypothetical protein